MRPRLLRYIRRLSARALIDPQDGSHDDHSIVVIGGTLKTLVDRETTDNE